MADLGARECRPHLAGITTSDVQKIERVRDSH